MKETKLITRTPEEFQKLIEGSSNACLVVVGASWCGSYHMISRQIHELTQEFKLKMCVHHIDFDSSKALMQHYGLSLPPALLFFSQGQLMDKLLETAPKHIIRNHIMKLIW